MAFSGECTMPPRPSRRARKKTRAQRSADRNVLKDIEYFAAGGWRGAVGALIYLLRVFRGHWLDEADRLERLLQGIKEPSLEEEQVLLQQVQVELASIYNQPRADLSVQQQSHFKVSLREAIRQTRQRQRTIPAKLKGEERIRRRVIREVARSEALAAATPPTTEPLPPSTKKHLSADEPGPNGWSKADSPSRWAKAFGLGLKTLQRRIQEGKIRCKHLSVKSYQIAVDDLPASQKSKHLAK
jgi:hypothetical protein